MEQVMVGTRISSSGQTTIPSTVRNALHASIGSTIYWTVDERGVANVSASPLTGSDGARPSVYHGPRNAHGFCDLTPSSVIADEAQAKGFRQETTYSEWPSSFWNTLGALDDPTFTVPSELNYADDAPRLSFD